MNDRDAETHDDRRLPVSRTRRPGATGTPVAIGGMWWLFAGYVPRPEPVWDDLFDANLLAGRYERAPLLAASMRLLYECHDVTPEEAADLVLAAETEDLVAAVERAMIGPEETHRTWSSWVNASLWSNGIDPASVPPADRREVLDMLVATGRALPPSKWVSSVDAAKQLADLRSLVKP